MEKFKVGDIVRCNPENWYDPINLKQRLKVTFATDESVMVSCSERSGFDELQWKPIDLILCEETVVDRILTKYSK